jgi:hypothetical protein
MSPLDNRVGETLIEIPLPAQQGSQGYSKRRTVGTCFNQSRLIPRMCGHVQYVTKIPALPHLRV